MKLTERYIREVQQRLQLAAEVTLPADIMEEYCADWLELSAEIAALLKVRLAADVLCDDCYTTSIDWNREWVEDRDSLRVALDEYAALRKQGEENATKPEK